jgi:uncharacterized protein (DUF1501 family)
MLGKFTTRRELLGYGMGVVGVSSALPNYLINTALADPAAAPSDRVIVVIQLSGGHDAMSALVPYGHAEYGQLRKATRILDNEVIKLNNELGLHPNLKGFKEMADQGAFVAIPGVGYPNPNLSHFHSEDIWHTGDMRGRGTPGPYGWAGRTADVVFKGNADPKLAIAVGMGHVPIAMQGREHPGIAFDAPEGFRYAGDRGDANRANLYRKLNELAAERQVSTLQFVTSTAIAANAASDQIRQLAAAYKPKVEYPDYPLARWLRSIAGLIVGGLSARIYFTHHPGGFDTHSGQRPHHDNLMRFLNDSVSAFYKDLTAHGQAKRVLAFTTSEFGRTARENGSQGTDHGAAASMFLFGPMLKAGVHGAHPSLKDVFGGGGDWLKMATDFRSVYATVLEKWLGTPSEPILGGKFPIIDCFA